MLPSYPLLALALSVSPLEIDFQGAQHVVESFERAGLPVPHGDPVLAEAAHRIAQGALQGDAAADLEAIALEVSNAQGFDPVPRALVFRGAPRTEALRSLLNRPGIGEQPASHFGMASAYDGDRAALVLLAVDRKLTLRPFPRALPATGGKRELCGEVKPPLDDPEIYLSRPGGDVEKILPSERRGQAFCARIPLTRLGRYSVEVVASSQARGPEVVGLFFVDVGSQSQRTVTQHFDEPSTLREARSQIKDRVNAVRSAHGEQLLDSDDFLDKIAQSYSEQMASQNFFGHVAPSGLDMKARLRAAGYVYGLAAENIARASGPLAAHFALEYSPGHRKNLLEPAIRRLGVGIVFQQNPPQVLLTELYAAPSRELKVNVDQRPVLNPSWGQAPEPAAPTGPSVEPVYDSAERIRRSHHLPGLERSSILELHRLAASEGRDGERPGRGVAGRGSSVRRAARHAWLAGCSRQAARQQLVAHLR